MFLVIELNAELVLILTYGFVDTLDHPEIVRTATVIFESIMQHILDKINF
jgi:hypothetical protein